AAWYHPAHMIRGSNVDRRRTERVPVQTRFGELDHVLVAMRDGAVDELIFVPFAGFYGLRHRGIAAKAGVEPTSRLPGKAQRSARRSLADRGRDFAEGRRARDTVDKRDRRPDIVCVDDVNPREHLSELRDKR